MSAETQRSVRSLAQTVADKLGLGSEPDDWPALVSQPAATRAAAAEGVGAAAAEAAEALAESGTDEAAAERLLAVIQDATGADCVALWLRSAGDSYCIAEAGVRAGAPRRDLVNRAYREQRPVGNRARPADAALVIPVRFREEPVGAIEIAGSTDSCSASALSVAAPLAQICAVFLARIRAVAAEDEARRLLAAVLEELDEGVLVIGDDGAQRCSNRRMTELLGVLQPDGAAVHERLDAFLEALPDDGVLEDNVVIARASGATKVTLHGAHLSVAGGCAVVVASDAVPAATTSPDVDEDVTKRLAALGSFSVGQGHDVARLARAIAENLHAIESGPAREVLTQAGQLEAITAARASAAGVIAIGDEISQIQESAGVVLLVDDEESARRTLARMLERGGYRVYAAAHAAEALQLARRYAGLIDVVVSDLVLPVMSGQRLLHELAEWQPRARHLVISGRTTGDLVHVGRDGRPLPFLAKPFSYDVLHAAVAALMQQRRPYVVESRRGAEGVDERG